MARSIVARAVPILLGPMLSGPWLRVLVLPGLLLCGCQPAAGESATELPAELEGVRVVQAFESLRPQLGEKAQLLELRANSGGLSIQVIKAELTPARVVEYLQPFEADGQPGNASAPRELPLRGSGDMTENAFALDELDVPRIVAAFSVARRTVDPTDGRVRELVVRRLLPFQRGVRARIFVDSPRMSGSIDTNPSGTPLRP